MGWVPEFPAPHNARSVRASGLYIQRQSVEGPGRLIRLFFRRREPHQKISFETARRLWLPLYPKIGWPPP